MKLNYIKYVLPILLILLAIETKGSNRNYHNVSPKEGVYVHTDKDIYFAGDVVLFKLYRFNLNQQADEWKSKAAYLTLVGQRGNFVAKRELMIKNDTHHGYIQIPDTLSSGIYRMEAWTNSMLMNNSPLFVKQIFIVNRFDSNPILQFAPYLLDSQQTTSNKKDDEFDENPLVTNTSLDTAKVELFIKQEKESEYGTRKKIRLTFDIADINDDIASASVGVARAESFFVNTRNFTSYINKNPNISEYQAQNILRKVRILPENYGLVLSGRVIDISNRSPQENVTVMLSTIDTLVNLKYFVTLPDGAFYFIIDEFYEGKKLYLSIYNETPNFKNLEVVVDNKFFSSSFDPLGFVVHPDFNRYIEECMLIKRAQKAYGVSMVEETVGGVDTRIGSSYLYKSAVSTIKPADYVPIDNFVELTNEIIPVLRIQKQRYSYSTKMVGARTRSLLPREPQFFLDGIYIPNLGDIVNLSSDEIDHIDVINHPWALGNLEFSGIVAVFSKKNEHKKLNRDTGHTTVEGISSTNGYQLIFPDYETDRGNENFPDFREVLYWCPNLRAESSRQVQIEFFSGDIKGEYIATLEGITKDGKPFTKKIQLTVK